MGLGGERCGTSWIYGCLDEHPRLCMPFKTVNFFHRDDNYGRGLDWYEGHFRQCGDDKLAGEITTAYLYSTAAPQRIHEYHPGVKLFVSLRNPVDRAFSHYQNEVRAGIIDRSVSFGEALEQRPICVENGLYTEALRRYLSLFPQDQLLILIYEDCLEDPEGFIGSIYEFLGVDSSFRPSTLHSRVNEGGVPRSVGLDLAMDGAANTLRRLGMQRLIGLAKRSGVAALARGANIRSQAEPMTPEQRSDLKERYAPDIRELEGLIHRDLSLWLS